MQYIIQNASIISNKKLQDISLLIQGQKIRNISTKPFTYSVMRMDAESFVITPTFVFYKSNLPNLAFSQFKGYFTTEFLLKGCGLLITDFSVEYVAQIDQALKNKRTSLLSSPIDYVLGLTIPANKLNVNVIHKCKREKIPILFVQLKNIGDLKTIPWGWIREALYPNYPILIPTFDSNLPKINQKYILNKWREIMEGEKILHLDKPLNENTPLAMEQIKKIGLFPKKGFLNIGSEISYNLFLKDKDIKAFISNVSKGSLTPTFSVHKGKFMIENNQPLFRSGYGEELKLKRTSLFI